MNNIDEKLEQEFKMYFKSSTMMYLLYKAVWFVVIGLIGGVFFIFILGPEHELGYAITPRVFISAKLLLGVLVGLIFQGLIYNSVKSVFLGLMANEIHKTK